MQERLPGIFTWSVLSEPHGYDFNGTVILHPEGNLCIDPVEPSAAVLDHLDRLGIARILVTNRNHTRGANAVRERTGARLALHPADAPHAREQGVPPDDELAIGQRIGPFTVEAAFGKSPGEIALHDLERRILVVGDVLIGNPPGGLSLLPEKVMDDPGLLRESVTSLLDLDFDVLLAGDGVSVLTGAKERLRELIASF